jgi:hypothetical protein
MRSGRICKNEDLIQKGHETLPGVNDISTCRIWMATSCRLRVRSSNLLESAGTHLHEEKLAKILAQHRCAEVEDRIVSAIGTYDATASFNGSNWSMQMATFRASNTPVSLMSDTGSVTNSIGRVKYRLSAGSAQPAGTYTTIITYTIYATY